MVGILRWILKLSADKFNTGTETFIFCLFFALPLIIYQLVICVDVDLILLKYNLFYWDGWNKVLSEIWISFHEMTEYLWERKSSGLNFLRIKGRNLERKAAQV